MTRAYRGLFLDQAAPPNGPGEASVEPWIVRLINEGGCWVVHYGCFCGRP